MNTNTIQAALADSFADFKLSKGEKYAFRELLQDVKDDGDLLRFARNHAFDLVKRELRRAPIRHYDAVKWLEQIVKTIDALDIGRPTAEPSAHFGPGDDCADRIIGLLRGARAGIDICVFTISDDRISREIAQAHHRGIDVRIITDNDKSADRGSDIDYFIEQGIAVRMDATPNHMHHKFAVFDGRALVNGSFNWTRSASRYNDENITVLYESTVVQAFMQVFEGLWERFGAAD